MDRQITGLKTPKISLDNYVSLGVMLQRRHTKDDHMINSPNCHKNIMSPRQPPQLPHYNFNLMRQIETNGKFYCKIAVGTHAMF